MKRLVLDSNIVLLDATNILTLGKDAIVVLPEIVLKEVDNKKTGFNELAYQARQMGRILATFDVQYTNNHHSGLIITTLHNAANKVTVEVVSLDRYEDIDPKDSGANDQKIIQVAQRMQEMHGDVTFITNDVIARIRGIATGLSVTDLKLIDDAEFEFTKELVVEDPEVFRTLHDANVYQVDPNYKLENYSYKFTDEMTGQVKLATVTNGFLKVLGKDTEKIIRQQDCAPINSEQLLASKAILDQSIDLVVIEGQAGSGKNIVALSNAIKLFKTNRDKYRSILYIRTPQNDEQPGEDIGYLSQPLYSKILTPTGWVNMGDIRIGDTVCTPNGRSAKVKTLSPITKKVTYKVETKDGGVTYASGEHLWSIEYGKKERLMTTLEIKKELEGANTYKKKNMFLPPISVQEFANSANLLLDPYLVGYLIGDGMIGGSHVRIAIGDNDAKESLHNLRNSIVKDFPEYTIKRSSSKNYAYTISKNKKGTTKGNKIREHLEYYNLLCKADKKRIPREYLQSSIKDRIELLRGLIDSDGTIRKSRGYSSEVCYTSINYDLLTDIRELVKSLGGRGKISQKTDRGPKKVLGIVCNSKPSYTISISGLSFNPAKLKRKAANYVQGRPQREKIVCVTEHKEELVRCISLDDTAHLYITDDYIPTHNSGNDEKYAMYLGPMEDTLEFLVKQNIKQKSGEKKQEFEERVAAKMLEIKEECGMQATITTGLRGKTFHNTIIILDEWQNASQATSQKVLTRVGKDCKVIVTASQAQIDNKYVTKYNNGLAVLMGEARERAVDAEINMFAIELKKVVRSKMAEFAEKLYTEKR